MKKSILILLGLITLGLTGCNKKGTPAEGEVVSYVQQDDKDMNDAIDKARKTFDQFENAFSEKKSFSNFIVKEGFPTKKGGKEHLWISTLKHDGKNFIGIVVNEPVEDVDVKYGDTITFDRNLISDWMYTDTISHLTYGAYTIRVFTNRMKADEKADFMKENGFNFAPLDK